MKRIKWGLAAFVLTLIFFGCSDGNGGGDDEEFNEEDFYVTDQVIGSSANQAGLSFLATPDISLFADQIETAHDNRFTWSVGNLAQISGSSTNFITGKTNQLATTGSGFQFSINTKAVNTDALRPAIGFGAIFMFTAESNNLGTTYSSLRTALEALPQYEGGWVMPEASVLTGLGIKVFTMHGDTP
jgi:hypothetical protein